MRVMRLFACYVIFMKIFKYVLHPDGNEIALPKGAAILSVAFQGDQFCFWAKVNPDEMEKEVRIFRVFGTGHDMPQEMGIDYKFLGTGWMSDGLVFHAFELV